MNEPFRGGYVPSACRMSMLSWTSLKPKLTSLHPPAQYIWISALLLLTHLKVLFQAWPHITAKTKFNRQIFILGAFCRHSAMAPVSGQPISFFVHAYKKDRFNFINVTIKTVKTIALKRCLRQHRQVETLCHQVDSCHTTLAVQENTEISWTFERDRGSLQ